MMPGPDPSSLFNVCDYLLDRHIREGRGDRLALTGVPGNLSYAELAGRVTHAAGGLRALGLQPEQRVVMVMADSPEFVIVYLAAIRIGAVPVPVSTMLRADGVAEILADSRARVVAVSAQYLDLVTAALGYPGTGAVMAVVTDDAAPAVTAGGRATTALGRLPGGPGDIYPTTADSPAFWLYTSGTTGTPKGAMHRHGSVQVVCETYGAQVLGITAEDRCLSAAKAFFAYGLGNSILFPMSVGAAAVLEPTPSRPEIMAERSGRYAATLFFAGPTFFSNMLRAGLPADALAGARLAASAGEALPAALYQRWTSHFGVDILDGIGMTEMLHIFLSNRPGQVRAGTTGVAVPGYDLRVLGEDGLEVARARQGPCSSGAPPPRPGTGPATTPPARCSRGSGCARATPTRWTPTGITRAWGVPGTCSRPAASGSHRPRWSRGCWPTTTWPRPWWWPRTTPTGWRSPSRSSSSIPGPRWTRRR
jgi:acyl-coenzyme A synthetase/AMP-(fatty) acid ligase